MNEKNIATKKIILSPEIKKGRVKLIVKSKIFYEFIIEINFPDIIKYEDLIKGIFDGLYIKPNIYDIFFYFINTKKSIANLTDQINELGLTNKSYIIYLDEKKYIENSCVIKSEVYFFKHEENSFIQIPVYLERNEDNFFLDSYKKCQNEVKRYEKDLVNMNYLPIIVIKYFEYKNVIDFLKYYYKYINFRSIPILAEKLIIPADKNYSINHIPNDKEANFFMETTDTNNYQIYSENDIREIIEEIKNQANQDKIYFQKNKFRLDIEKWVRTVFNILAEYIQFQLNINPIYYVCKNCLYPIIFLDKRNVLSYMDIIIKKLDKKIKEDIHIINCIINLITPSYFKDDSLPEINVLYYNEEENNETLDKDCDLFIKSISGCFILSTNMTELEIILKEINSEYSFDNTIKFQLILSPKTAEKITNYLFDTNYILLFDQICIYSKTNEPAKDIENIKIIYKSIDKDIHIYQTANSIVKLFFNIICVINKTNCYKFTKVVNYSEYLETYYKFHEKISLHYGNISYLTFNNNIGIIQDFINSIDEKTLKIKTNEGEEKRKALIEALLIFENVAKQRIENFKDVINVYTKEKYSFYQDLNNWLRNLDSLAYDKIGYFVSDFMYCLNKYGEFKKTGINNNTTLYRGVRINLIDLLFYKRNKNKLITFPSFTSSSLDINDLDIFTDINETAEYRKQKGLFSVIFTINYNVSRYTNIGKYYPVCFDITQLNQCGEKEVLFQPFTFFKIKKVDIDLDNYIADITLKAVKKLDILELYIKDKYKLKYNKIYKIVEIPEKTRVHSILKSDESEKENENENDNNNDNTEIKINNSINDNAYNDQKEKVKNKPIINKCEITLNLTMNLIEENFYYEKIKAYKYQSKNTIYDFFGNDFIQKNRNKIKFSFIKITEDNKNINIINADLNEGYLLVIQKKEKVHASIFEDNKPDTIQQIQATFNIEFKNINDMSYMFYNCSNLISIEKISNWNTSKIINMKSLFEGCINLQDLEKKLDWDTSKITDMSNMFRNCKKLNFIPDISSWNLSEVKDINYFFSGCENIKSITNLFVVDNSPKLKDAISIFEGCSNLESLPNNISKWNLSSATNIKSIFSNCISLKAIPNIDSWNASNATNINSLFKNCSSLTTLPQKLKWNTSNLIDIGSLFYNCSSLVSIPDISIWNTDNVKNISSLFYNCCSINSLPEINKWNTKNVINMDSCFKNCKNLTSIPDISNWDTSNVINLSSFFYNCSSLNILPDISKWNTNKVRNLSNLFSNCLSLTVLPDISKWNTENVDYINSLCENCESLKTIPNIFCWNLQNVVNMSCLFKNCKLLSSLSNNNCSWETNKVTNMSEMFSGCESLISMIDFSKWNVSKVTDMSGMFRGCKLIKRFPRFNKWDISNLNNASEMFRDCSSLESFPSVGLWNIEKVGTKKKMFYGCVKIKMHIPLHFGTLIEPMEI